MRKLLLLCCATLAIALLAGCKKTYFGMEPVEPLPALQVAFADPAWDGKNVPSGQTCSRCGGAGAASPRLTVSGIPAGADALIVEFNDLSYPPLSSGGGHGAVKIAVPAGRASLEVPSIPGETKDVPAGVSIVRISSGDVSGITNGAYLPPCSGGRGNLYQAMVHAVDSKTNRVLAQGRINLGRY